jgi:formate/nitrite transporter FocA (FNT family)
MSSLIMVQIAQDRYFAINPSFNKGLARSKIQIWCLVFIGNLIASAIIAYPFYQHAEMGLQKESKKVSNFLMIY